MVSPVNRKISILSIPILQIKSLIIFLSYFTILTYAQVNKPGYESCPKFPCLAICPPKDIPINKKSLVAEEYVNYTAIPKIYTTNETLDDETNFLSPEKQFHILLWEPCSATKSYYLQPQADEDKFYLLKNGSLYLPRATEVGKKFIDFGKYCLKKRSNFVYMTPRICCSGSDECELDADDSVDSLLDMMKYIGGLVSVPFLIATVIIYSILPELRNIHGKTLRCYLCCMIANYVLLAVIRIPNLFGSESTTITCLQGFVIYFFALASFLWLNVVCFDLWWRFGACGSMQRILEKYDYNKFIIYSIYVWGVDIGLTTIYGVTGPPSIALNGSDILYAASTDCWFKTKTLEAIYLYAPIGLTLACNICFFILTSIKLIHHERTTSARLNNGESRRHDDNEQRFRLYVRLFIVMGISWSTEIISWIWQNDLKYIFYVTDLFNGLQGFLIFIILVCKKNIFKSLKQSRSSQSRR